MKRRYAITLTFVTMIVLFAQSAFGQFIVASLMPNPKNWQQQLAETAPWSLIITPDSLVNERHSVELRFWKYHSGDNPVWADSDFDDGYWEMVDSWADLGDDFDGIGWYRTKIKFDSSLAHNLHWALTLMHSGPTEIYIDGELVLSYGKIGASKENEVSRRCWTVKPQPVFLDDAEYHVIAVRYSNHLSDNYKQQHGMPAGFRLYIGELKGATNYAMDYGRTIVGRQLLFTGATASFALLHFLLFIFYPRARGNLVYAFFAVSIAAIVFLPFAQFQAQTVAISFLVFWMFKLSVLSVSVFGLLFIYTVSDSRMPRKFWFLLAIGIVLGIFSWFISLGLIYIFSILTLIEMLRVIIVALFRRQPGIWIISAGGIMFAIMVLLQILGGFGIVNLPILGTYTPYLYGVFCQLISMSIFLAYNIAKINKDLEEQIVHVQKLSARTLDQERRAKEQEMQRKILEVENIRKAHQLDEASKRQKVLDQLAVANEELERTNRHLHQAQSQLVQSEKMASLGMLVAGIAHEINTPIGAVNSMHNTLIRAMGRLKISLETCSECVTGKTMPKLLTIIDNANDVITRGTDRVTEIVRRLRSFARLDEAELKKVDIHEGIEDTLMLIHHEIKHNITVVRNYSDIPPIACYPGQLNQVLLNLLINAKQAIKNKGEITITTYQQDSELYIEIGDNGIGIPENDLRRVFDPGYTTKGVGVGTGLGLSICYQIIKTDHKGRIKINSKVGVGTTFTIILPMNLDQNV
ncbi:MAG: ATP-binding protein [Candidatus Electryoneaceae bacterium]|nr:ATP-binding protein [Candidatus Electryoneaceae bacterium]